MTDITELAQSLKSAAEKATPGPWEVQFGEEIYATDGVDNEQVAIATLDARDTDYIALANPANVLALVEALEKAQQRIASQREYYEGVIADGGKRIAELESRTVKLPKPHAHLIWIQAGHAPDDYWDDVAVSHSEKDRCCDGSERYPVYARWEIEEMLAAAGIKVEAE
ncbi:ead/Ea22-like family protein [Klebsiella pneumoniae]|uniref:ead/Ea22-like family protein n=1 Tax=Klebsiella pneumoniae TaxID=573 RepID=UPI000E2CF3F9|nr:ead/Ea22-like family protein [Klebsiella pneumoniae]SYI33217.1 Ead domain protein [Klebsiella pneumoniae]HDV0352805.1 ead/Ea22-like family protein [Klebsiella pneumoniae]